MLPLYLFPGFSFLMTCCVTLRMITVELKLMSRANRSSAGGMSEASLRQRCVRRGYVDVDPIVNPK